MQFIFELLDIKEGGTDFSWEGAGENLAEEGDNLVFQRPLSFKLHLERNKEQVLVQGELNTTLELTCCRCLDKYPFVVKERVFALFVPQGQRPPEEEVELGAKELDLNYYSEGSLNLKNVLRDQLLLSLPMTPHCREECLGLCPSCGQNLNQGSCGCPQTGKTSPFEVLKKINLE